MKNLPIEVDTLGGSWSPFGLLVKPKSPDMADYCRDISKAFNAGIAKFSVEGDIVFLRLRGKAIWWRKMSPHVTNELAQLLSNSDIRSRERSCRRGIIYIARERRLREFERIGTVLPA